MDKYHINEEPRSKREAKVRRGGPGPPINLTRLDKYTILDTMKVLPLAEAKTHFSSVLKDVESGNDVAISYGKKRETIAVIISYDKWKRSRKRELGTLEGKGSVVFAEDFKMTDEGFVHL
jgi:prevent-host-death family protein